FNTSLHDLPCIGDALRDLQAAAAVGAQPILVLTGKGAQTQREGGLPPNTRVYADLADAVKSLVR
ncbi:MAG: HAD hydrolase-like protein, partial [Burkholderiales bacterium]